MLNRAMQHTPLHARHVALGGRMVDFAGWSMPVQYTTIAEEHAAVRDAAGLFDVSHMGRLGLIGPDASPLLDHLLTVPASALNDYRVRYTFFLNDAGGILDDVLVMRYPADEHDLLLLVVNASNREKIVAHIGERARGADLNLTDSTVGTALIAVQGPKSADILAPLCSVYGGAADPSELRYYRGGSFKVDGVKACVTRTGYTGEDGFEITVAADAASDVWDALLDAGRPHGLKPAGLGCRDTLRLEAAMPLYGHELDEQTDPLTAGLGFAVKLDDGRDFLGRDALLRVRENGPERVRVGFEMTGRRIARDGAAVLRNDDAVGLVTSGTHSPTLGRAIGMAYVPPDLAAVGTELTLDIRGRTDTARVVTLPFYKRQTMPAKHP